MLSYALYLLVTVCALGLLALATDVLAGHAGRVGLAAMFFAGIGGYTYAIASTIVGLGVWTSVLAACGAVLALSLPFAALLLAFEADAFLLATFALQMAFVDLVNNSPATGAALGIRGVAIPSLGRFHGDSSMGALLVLVPASLLSTLLLGAALSQRSRIGRAIHAIRDDARSAFALGLPVRGILVALCAVQALLAGLAGTGSVIVLSYVNPQAFGLWLSLSALTAMFVGGTGGHPAWAFAGTAFVTAVSELCRTLPTGPELVGPLQQVVFNVLLIVVLLYRKRGFGGPIIEAGPGLSRLA